MTTNQNKMTTALWKVQEGNDGFISCVTHKEWQLLSLNHPKTSWDLLQFGVDQQKSIKSKARVKVMRCPPLQIQLLWALWLKNDPRVYHFQSHLEPLQLLCTLEGANFAHSKEPIMAEITKEGRILPLKPVSLRYSFPSSKREFVLYLPYNYRVRSTIMNNLELECYQMSYKSRVT
jgi:hypothetical protein